MQFLYGSGAQWQILNILTKFGEDWSISDDMATDLRNSRWRPLPSSIPVNMHYWCNSCVQHHILNFPTKFGDDWSNSNEMATDFRNSRWRRPPSWILGITHSWCNSCVQWQTFNIPTEFGEDWSNSKEMATDFRNTRWRRPPSWIYENMHFYVTVVFCVRFSTFTPNLMMIGAIVIKWQAIFEIQDGGGCHLEST